MPLYFQVTGDNVHSLALCDFDGDGKKEVGGKKMPLGCVLCVSVERGLTLILELCSLNDI